MGSWSRHGAGAGRRPTLEDLAARTGMSRSLVSLVMRGARTGATAETRRAGTAGRRRDRLPARRPRPPAGQRPVPADRRGLRDGRAAFHMEFLDGLYVAAQKADYQLILSALTPRRDEREAVETLLDFRCEAVILLAPDRAMPVLAGRLPTVTVGWQAKDPAVDVVRTSDDEGMRLAVDHLVDLGHRRILHVDGGTGPVSASRRRGYRAAMRRRGLGEETRASAAGSARKTGPARPASCSPRTPCPPR